ncbi:MAG: SDR family NAD(P)-dependent oxidoreductase [Candidatus Micrarchaeaceae archaeon]|jgi:UDP-glucose 4-epimerase
MKILITGGAGFIGSHICEKYVKEGHTVLCLDHFESGNISNIRSLLHLKNFKLITGDVRNLETVEKATNGVDVVFHLAAQIHVDRSIIEPKLTYDTNVMGTLNVLEAARMLDVKKVIYASSSEVYGSAQTVPIKEDHPLDAPHIYGASKTAADRMCLAYIDTYGMDVAIVRNFNIFGPRQRDTGYGGVISIFAKRVMNNEPPIIYGDGKQTRDYTYVQDTVAAYDCIFKYSKPIPKPINFGTGKEVSIMEVANKIIKYAGKEKTLKPVFVDKRPGEVDRLIADASYAKKLLGWEPKYSFDKGLESLMNWYKNYRFEQWTKAG